MTDLGTIREALDFIPADERDLWVRIGMAIKSELGESGFGLWDAWSQQASSYNSRDARDVWKSVRADGPITVGTLFHEAKARGWRDQGRDETSPNSRIADRPQLTTERGMQDSSERERERADTAQKANEIWTVATEPKASHPHPYLARKQVLPVSTLREIEAAVAGTILGYRPRSGGEPLDGPLLVVPVKIDDALSTVELIDSGGRKAALAGRGTKAGGYWAAQPMPEGDGTGETLLIGEGVATVLSARQATGHLAVAALSSTNLPAVARAARQRFPAAKLVILADLLKTTGEADPYAIKAAQEVGGTLAFPDFGDNRAADETDFNDMAIWVGSDAVERVVAAATAPYAIQVAVSEADSGVGPSVTLLRGSEIKPEPVAWLWDGWLARGKMHILGGAPGTGKTTIAMALAATVSAGGRWPDGTSVAARNVVIWSGEDDPADTLVPRLRMSGADMSHVYFISDVKEGSGSRSFDPARDMETLRRKLAEIGGAKLLIIDPIVSAVSGDSHKNAEVRRGLQPLADLAASEDCAALGITHLSKGTGGRDPLERLTGSIAFGAVARLVFIATKHRDEENDGRTTRLFLRVKSNIGLDSGGFEYELEDCELRDYPGIRTARVLWRGPVQGDARELLALAEAGADESDEGAALAEAKQFLTDLLADGPVSTEQIKADAANAGVSWSNFAASEKSVGYHGVQVGHEGWMVLVLAR